ncbi:glycosyltransferase family 2 protein [Trichococcus pasteurii]|uniref:2-c-methyl-d-erythritol 4-phosphate cytidylyltransferase n=1 Tax=Trichococcus pasteurii TaxID=43064 RepID=A0A1W1IIG0_9LACT|nr:glycosyltransferase family 2 protein [Trichococcus pasteurii]SFF09067.1 2-C-methyl-D-erythritol 4-phosphate cytidylyltransferase [Trichococcus pasteurii]SLM52741.1 2-c-methyl-d-erythritol 4-phosphate cytidylyltransferase [Trichococcus pasteurii]SSB93622.1 2-c-methyl-d-erythritol 4-phosphate cytidylyltransferase [Trichococcus pasteurii]
MNKEMTIIITMAGQGSRFKKAGYQEPKYMIEAKGKTLFEWSMDSLMDYNPYVKKYIFIVQEQDDASSFILEKCKKYQIREVQILELDHLTDGQATTCMLAIPYCNPSDAIMVYNIDTYVEPFELKYSDIKGEGHIPCFYGAGNHWSFVKLDDNLKVTEVREKSRISNNCSIGAYYFSSAKLFEELYNDYYTDKSNLINNEKFIAPLYNHMISKKLECTHSIVNLDKVHVLGTPEELNIFINKHE